MINCLRFLESICPYCFDNGPEAQRKQSTDLLLENTPPDSESYGSLESTLDQKARHIAARNFLELGDFKEAENQLFSEKTIVVVWEGLDEYTLPDLGLPWNELVYTQAALIDLIAQKKLQGKRPDLQILFDHAAIVLLKKDDTFPERKIQEILSGINTRFSELQDI